MLSTTVLLFRDPGEIRTLDPMIKSHLLYQLSYGVIYASFCRVANMQIIFFFGRLNYSQLSIILICLL